MIKYTSVAHYIAGIITALAYMVSWVLPLCGLLVFLVYELNQSQNIPDPAYEEIMEFAIGYFASLFILEIYAIILLWVVN